MQTGPARAQDLAPALALLREAQLPEQGVTEAFGDFVVARESGRLLGLCGLEVYGDAGLLRSLVVAPDQRGRGLGEALVAATLERARERGLRSVYLLTTTARGFFLKRGFANCAREQAPARIRESWEFKRGCPASSAFMRLALGT